MKVEQEVLIVMALAALVVLLLLWFVGLLIRVNSIRDRSLGDPRCPSCGIRDVRPSEPRGPRDRLYGFFSCVPFRCRSCCVRFYRSFPPAASNSPRQD